MLKNPLAPAFSNFLFHDGKENIRTFYTPNGNY